MTIHPFRFARPRHLVRPLIWLGLALTVYGCSGFLSVSQINVSNQPIYVDDGSTADLLQAIEHHLHYLAAQPADRQFLVGKRRLTGPALIDSLHTFRSIIRNNPDPIEMSRQIREHFDVFEAAGRNQDNRMLVTGYYEPLFLGSLEKQAPFVYPIYSPPDSLVTQKNKRTKERKTGRLDSSGRLVPYWSRQEIESGSIAEGFEIAFLSDPLDAYLLHVQGSGRILLPDGSIRSVHFAGSNGRAYKSLGKLFVDRGIMPREEVNIPAIRQYFKLHPEKMQGMLHHNPRFIFFNWADDSGPRGSLGETLTPGRSIAIDHAVLPSGAIAYLVSRRPVLNEDGSINHWRPFGRFVLPQDSGSAIKGTGRVDLFWGSGDYAETAASHMNEQGKLFFLIKKDFELPEKIR